MQQKGFRVHVKLVQGDTYDIFWGLGWDNWSRVRVVVVPNTPAKFEHVAGFQLPFYGRIATAKYLRLPTQ